MYTRTCHLLAAEAVVDGRVGWSRRTTQTREGAQHPPAFATAAGHRWPLLLANAGLRTMLTPISNFSAPLSTCSQSTRRERGAPCSELHVRDITNENQRLSLRSDRWRPGVSRRLEILSTRVGSRVTL